jgi:hypothetical protein
MISGPLILVFPSAEYAASWWRMRSARSTPSQRRRLSYLSALTKELEEPGKGHLDAYLKHCMRDAIPADRLAEEIVQAPGLDGTDEQNEALGKTSDPILKARYEQQKLNRKRGT